MATTYSSPAHSYSTVNAPYNVGYATYTLVASGSGNGNSSVVFFVTHFKSASGSGAGASASTQLRTVFSTAFGSGTGFDLAIDNTAQLRSATGVAVGAENATLLRTAVRNAAGVASGASVVTYVRTTFGAGTASGAGSEGVIDVYKGIRSATASGGSTLGDSAVRKYTALRQVSDAGDGTATVVSYTTHFRALTNGGEGGAAVQSFATLLRFSTAAGTSSSSSGWRIRKMARYTVGNVIERVRRQLNSTMRTETNVVAAPMTSADTVVTFQFALSNSLRPGAVISVGTELMRVVSTEPNTQEVTVIRGWQDSEASAILAGTEAAINPRFTRFDVFDALIDEIASWETEIYRVESYQWDVGSDVEAVELPADLASAIGVVEVVRERNDDRTGVWPRLKFRLQRGSVGTWDAVTTSGLLIRLVFTPDQSRAGKIHALVAVPFDVGEPLAESSNLVTVLGMTPSQVDLLVQGIKVRLLADDENVRSSRQAADASLALNQYNAASNLEHLQVARAVYLRRYSDELNKLRAKYPYKSW